MSSVDPAQSNPKIPIEGQPIGHTTPPGASIGLANAFRFGEPLDQSAKDQEVISNNGMLRALHNANRSSPEKPINSRVKEIRYRLETEALQREINGMQRAFNQSSESPSKPRKKGKISKSQKREITRLKEQYHEKVKLLKELDISPHGQAMNTKMVELGELTGRMIAESDPEKFTKLNEKSESIQAKWDSELKLQQGYYETLISDCQRLMSELDGMMASPEMRADYLSYLGEVVNDQILILEKGLLLQTDHLWEQRMRTIELLWKSEEQGDEIAMGKHQDALDTLDEKLTIVLETSQRQLEPLMNKIEDTTYDLYRFFSRDNIIQSQGERLGAQRGVKQKIKTNESKLSYYNQKQSLIENLIPACKSFQRDLASNEKFFQLTIQAAGALTRTNEYSEFDKVIEKIGKASRDVKLSAKERLAHKHLMSRLLVVIEKKKDDLKQFDIASREATDDQRDKIEASKAKTLKEGMKMCMTLADKTRLQQILN